MMTYEYVGFARNTPEETNTALIQWLFQYGYQWVEFGELFRTSLDHSIHWDVAMRQGIMEHSVINRSTSYRLTPKVHEYLEQYNGHENKHTSSPVA